MECSRCKSVRTKVQKTEHRVNREGRVELLRTRWCPWCGARWRTMEVEVEHVRVRGGKRGGEEE